MITSVLKVAESGQRLIEARLPLTLFFNSHHATISYFAQWQSVTCLTFPHQWRGEVAEGLPGWSDADRTHLEEELSDVLIYLLRLSDKCGVDISRYVRAACGACAARQYVGYMVVSQDGYWT